MSITIHITGPNTAALATEVEAFLTDAFVTAPEQRMPLDGRGTQRGDPLAVAALVLAVPSAVAATLDLAARARLADRIDQLLARLRGTASSEDTVRLAIGTTADLDLIATERDAVLDRLEQAPGEDSAIPASE